MNELFQYGSPSFLLLALFIICFATYITFNMQWKRRAGSLLASISNFVGPALVFTLGLWTMHVVFLLATNFMLHLEWTIVFYFSATTCLVAFSLRCYHNSRLPARLVEAAASFLMSAGIVSLHYISMFSHSFHRIELHLPLFFVSVLISFSGCYAAFALLRRRTKWRCAAASASVGISSMAMHAIGMYALTVEYRHLMTSDRLNQYMMLLAFILGIMVVLMIAFSYTTWLSLTKYNQIDERYKLLVENSTDTIAIIVDGKWEYLNPSGLRLFEAESESELVGECIFKLLHGANHLEMEAWLAHATDGAERELRTIELHWHTIKGKPILTEMVHMRTIYGGKQAEQVILRDISERKRREQLYVNAEKLSIAGELAAGVAHEIRNPLTSLKGFMQLIASGRVQETQFLPIMKAELSRIESTVTELLMLSKPQAIELKPTNLRELLSECSAALGAQASVHRVRIRHRFKEKSAWVLGVKIQLRQAFINVMKNAIEAMPVGGLLLIELRRADCGVLLVSLADNGTGMPDEQLAKLGQPFYSTKDKGTGLGLLVTYKIINHHNGQIGIESQLGVGTTLKIQLPSVQEPDVSGRNV
ncbi:MAG: domain S-box protein [Paenibacillus sp.]|jgi:PAS domain S-box-containing protein|nr:domain S-box protein [Paenibacillus sp.]